MKSLFFTVALTGFCAFANAQNSKNVINEQAAVKELYFEGLKDKLNENYAKAAISFEKIIGLDANNDAAYFEIANVNLRQSKLADAEVAIGKALSLKPQNIWYLKLQTEVFKQSGNMDALVNTFNQLIKLDPEKENYYFDRANALFIAGKTEESLNAYNALEKKFGASKQSVAAKQRFAKMPNYNASADFKQLILDKPTDVSSYLKLSGILLEKGKNEEALDNLLKAKQIDPNNYEVNLALADSYHALKRGKEAFDCLALAFANNDMSQSLKIKILKQVQIQTGKSTAIKYANTLAEMLVAQYPDDASVQVLYGDILYQQGKLNLAKEQYTAAVKKSEQLYIAWEKLLGVQTLMGNYAEAIKTGDEALTIYPNQAIIYYYRAFALHRNGQNAEANLELKNALQLEADDNNLKSMILALQAEVFIDQGKLKEADIAFDKAVALAPDNYLTISNYAYYLALRNHDLTKAERFAQKAANALPNNASVLDTYAMVLFKLSKFAEALKYIQLALKNNEDKNPVYLEHYGDILFANGQKESAVLQWISAKQQGNLSDKLNRKINEKKYIK